MAKSSKTKNSIKSAVTEKDPIESLFENFHPACYEAFSALEVQYGVQGLLDQVFGKNLSVDNESAKRNLKSNIAWSTLLKVYEYATKGINPAGTYVGDLIIDAANVLKLASSENNYPSLRWDNIISMADGRFALDEGSSFEIYKLALLANVDIRTVRNAASGGELVTYKCQITGELMVENSSARVWLNGRKGFRPTVFEKSDPNLNLKVVHTPSQFATFMAQQRLSKLLKEDDIVIPSHSGIHAGALNELEAGIFNLPLNAATVIADFYGLNRRDFLNCVMRVFFEDELNLICSNSQADGIQHA